jgi:flagellar operon protein
MTNSIKKPDMIISPQPVRSGQTHPSADKAKDARFDKILQKEIQSQDGLRISEHAAKRLQSRNISLTDVQKAKLNQAVDKAAGKGVKDSLILLNQLALVVNIKNRTVITALQQSQLRDGVVTNIDGAMIIGDEE